MSEQTKRITTSPLTPKQVAAFCEIAEENGVKSSRLSKELVLFAIENREKISIRKVGAMLSFGKREDRDD